MRNNTQSISARAYPWLLTALMASWLSACGFHLRGAANLPPEMAHTQLVGLARHGALTARLTRMLEANGIEVAPNLFADEEDNYLWVPKSVIHDRDDETFEVDEWWAIQEALI